MQLNCFACMNLEKKHCDYNLSFGRKDMDIIIINKFYFSIKFTNIVSKIQTIKYKYSDFQSSFFSFKFAICRI